MILAGRETPCASVISYLFSPPGRSAAPAAPYLTPAARVSFAGLAGRLSMIVSCLLARICFSKVTETAVVTTIRYGRIHKMLSFPFFFVCCCKSAAVTLNHHGQFITDA